MDVQCSNGDHNLSKQNDLQAELSSVEADLQLVEMEIVGLLDKQAELDGRRMMLLRMLEEACDAAQPSGSASSEWVSKSSGTEPEMTKQEEMTQYYNPDTLHVISKEDVFPERERRLLLFKRLFSFIWPKTEEEPDSSPVKIKKEEPDWSPSPSPVKIKKEEPDWSPSTVNIKEEPDWESEPPHIMQEQKQSLLQRLDIPEDNEVEIEVQVESDSDDSDEWEKTSEELQAKLDSVEADIQAVDSEIAELLKKQPELQACRRRLVHRLEKVCAAGRLPGTTASASPSGAGAALTKQELKRYDRPYFAWSKAMTHHMKNTFQLSRFRRLQRQAVNLSMDGRDLFLVMPPGGGKSLCYQLPAVCSNGFALVVTPLVSLIEDQIMYLTSINVPAVTLNTSSSEEHSKMVLDGMTETNTPFKLLYVTPEKIASKEFMSQLEKAKHLSLIAVDEVHCCSQLGHDFRPDYKQLSVLKKQFPNIPLLGVTATATSSVLKDCQKILCVPSPITITDSFNRKNLYYEVQQKDTKYDVAISDIASLISKRYKDQSGIVYVFSEKDADLVSSCFQKRGISAYPYHANMDGSKRSRVHRRWTSNKIKVVVATVAFGMGISKPDVRFVIHHTISKSIENYYQESGRAGRDDCPADCIVYFGFADIFRMSTMENIGQKKLLQMVDYCQNIDRCRRSLIAVHFQEAWNYKDCSDMCDACRHGKECVTVDITQHARQVVRILEVAGTVGEQMTPVKLLDVWTGTGPTLLRNRVQTTSMSRLEAQAVITRLQLLGYLSEDFTFTPNTTYVYLKEGDQAPLLRSQDHTVSMTIRKTAAESAKMQASGARDQKQAKEQKRAVESPGELPDAKKVKISQTSTLSSSEDTIK